MEVNKVVYNGDTLLDLTSDTVTPQTLVKGATAHDKSGVNITGTADYSISSTSTTSPLTDSADGMVQGLTIYGRSEVVDGEIKFVGEGYAVIDLGTLEWTYKSESSLVAFITKSLKTSIKNNSSDIIVSDWVFTSIYTQSSINETIGGINNMRIAVNSLGELWISNFSYTDSTEFKSAMSGVLLCYELADRTQGNAIAIKTDDGTGIDGTMATFTTALPLRSTLDGTTRDELIIGNGKAEVITRCEVVDDSIVPLATPITTPLTDAEISAFRGLRTYDNTTNITISDEPDFEINYLKNTENGQAVADIQKDLQEQIDEKITISPLLTLTVAGWDTSTLQQTILYSHSTSLRNVIDVDPASVEEWAACGIIARNETASGITFTCKSIPENALLFKVTSMGCEIC